MNDEEIKQRARTLLDMLGQDPHDDALTDVVEAMRGVRSEALEEAATRAFQIVNAIDGQHPYTTLQKAASVAAGVRGLKGSATGEEK